MNNKKVSKIHVKKQSVAKPKKNGIKKESYPFITSKVFSIAKMLKDKETLELMERALGDKKEVKAYIKRFHSKKANHLPNTYYRVEGGSGAGYAGAGNGLYLGKDKQALINFYDIKEQGLPVSVYLGEPKWLELVDYELYRKFEDFLSKKQIKIINSYAVGKFVMDLGYDGIRYFDPLATGEEFVLFNAKALRRKGRG